LDAVLRVVFPRSLAPHRFAGLEKGQGYRPGREIYLVACAGCHGVKGDAVGLGAQGFAQRPTDFRRGGYKFRSTAFGALPEI